MPKIFVFSSKSNFMFYDIPEQALAGGGSRRIIRVIAKTEDKFTNTQSTSNYKVLGFPFSIFLECILSSWNLLSVNNKKSLFPLVGQQMVHLFLLAIWCASKILSKGIVVDEPAPGLKAILSFRVPDQRSVALRCGTLMMFYSHEVFAFNHGNETAIKLLGSTPHDQLLIQTSDSFSGLLLFAVGILLFMVGRAVLLKGVFFCTLLWQFGGYTLRGKLEELGRDWLRLEELFCLNI